jgi:hypothetical protein
MTTNVSDTTPVPLNPTHSELAPFALLKNLSERSAAPKTPCNSIRASSIDDMTPDGRAEPIPMERKKSARPARMPLLEYRHPQQDQIPPLFMAGRYRFPSPSRRLLPTVFLQPEHAPLHPGMFPSPQFEEEIWSSHPINIVDSYIASISPEHTYFGIDYVIDVRDSVWAQKTVSRGTTINFRNFGSNVTRYIATWKLETVRNHTYVQFSPFRANQQSCYQDPDWPTIRIKVPNTLCKVPSSPHVQAIMKPSPVIITRSTPELKWWEVVLCCLCLSTIPWEDNYNDQDFLKF